MIVAWIIARKRGYKGDEKPCAAHIWTTFKDAILALLMPAIILGGIYGGVFTPTEAAVVAVVYGFVIGFFVYKELHYRDLKEILVNSVVGTAMIMFIIAAVGLVIGWVAVFLSSFVLPVLVAMIPALASIPFIANGDFDFDFDFDDFEYFD